MYRKLLVFSFSLAFLISGCAQQNPQALLGGNEAGSGSDPASLAQGAGGGAGVENGMGIDSSGTPLAPGDAAGIDSTGTISSTLEVQDASPGTGEGAGYGDSMPGAETGSGAALSWIEYKDIAQGFSLSYPDIYTILPESQALTDLSPNLIGRLRMLEPEIASSEFADMEPPKFSIEIYSNVQALSLDNWAQTNSLAGDVENIKIDSLDCKKISLQIQLAPNQFIICEHEDKIYKFTPMGLYSQEILDSFKFARP